MQDNSLALTAVNDAEIETQLESIRRLMPPMIRLPRPNERCPYSGQSRTGLVELVAPCERNHFKPPVAAIYLKKNERARRGVWLIPAENLFRYLLAQGVNTVASYAAMQQARKGEQTAE